MTAYKPIPPHMAAEICDLAQIAGSIERLADLAEAGIVKGYARLTETIHPDGRRDEVRDKRIMRPALRINYARLWSLISDCRLLRSSLVNLLGEANLLLASTCLPSR